MPAVYRVYSPMVGFKRRRERFRCVFGWMKCKEAPKTSEGGLFHVQKRLLSIRGSARGHAAGARRERSWVFGQGWEEEAASFI